jgi:hypothetical protein
MGVRFLVVWSAVGLALALSACGGTSKKPKATLGEQPNCGEDECPVECKAAAQFCFGRQIWRCNADGKSARLLETCAAAEACVQHGVAAACEEECEGDECETACVPEALVLYDDCDEAELEVCDETTLACASACPGHPACPEQACKPGDRLCMGDDVHLCQPDGSALVFSESCGDSANCVDDAPGKGFAYCKPNTCVPGQIVCHDNQVKVCAFTRAGRPAWWWPAA